MLSFLQIPLEIRREIFRHCLVARGPINPHPATFGPPKYATDEANKPSVQLLRVNEQIEAEVADVLYEENQWIVPVFHLPRNAAMIADKHYAKWRHVMVYIDYRNNDRGEWEKIVAISHTILPSQLSQDRMNHIHLHLRRYYGYELIQRCIAASWDIDNLHTLVLDLEYIYCVIDCCRLEVMESQVYSDLLSLHPVDKSKVQEILIKGLKTQKERDLACRN